MTGQGKNPPEKGGQLGEDTRFKKGTSGNPRGRPRKSAEGARTPPTEIAEMIKLETERPVTLTENGVSVTISALQAVFRATVMSAGKGNSHAQRTVLQMAGAVQAQEAKAKRDEYEGAILLKVQLDHERDNWVSKGRVEMDMPRHSSDIEIDPETGDVRSFLVFTREQVEARQMAISMRDFLLEKMVGFQLAVEEDGDDYFLEAGRDLAQALINSLNESLPSRFRRSSPSDPMSSSTASPSPEEVWTSMTRELALGLRRK